MNLKRTLVSLSALATLSGAMAGCTPHPQTPARIRTELCRALERDDSHAATLDARNLGCQGPPASAAISLAPEPPELSSRDHPEVFAQVEREFAAYARGGSDLSRLTSLARRLPNVERRALAFRYGHLAAQLAPLDWMRPGAPRDIAGELYDVGDLENLANASHQLATDEDRTYEARVRASRLSDNAYFRQ